METQRNLDPNILSLFQESDLKVEIITQDGEKITEARAYFESTIKQVVDRLHITGHPKDLQEEMNSELLYEKIRCLKEWSETADEGYKSKLEEEMDFLQNCCKKHFDKALRILIEEKIYGKEQYEGNDPYCIYLLKGPNSIFDNYPYGSSLSTILYFLHDYYDAEEKITYEFSELIDYEFFEFSVYNAYSDTMRNENFGHRFGEKIIIITEGTTDIQILKTSFELLYPHLKDYYYFMDFHIASAPGSTSSLVNTVKAFVGAGIKSKIIALFDNDTGAREALSTMDKVPIQKNISIQRLPYLEFAENYPTLGPTGETSMNINNLACSIELYLPEIFLKNDEGYFYPIQWTGYSSKMRCYQGEITNKEKVQKRFNSYIRELKGGSVNLEDLDFSKIKSIFKNIFDAFDPLELIED